MARAKLCILYLLLIYDISSSFKGLEVIPERGEISYANEKYVTNTSASVRRYGRRGGYVINISGYIKQTWENNVTGMIYSNSTNDIATTTESLNNILKNVINRNNGPIMDYIDVVLYEYLHNEYKRSFVEMHFKLCDMLNKDPLIGAQIKKRGFECPFPKGYYALTNTTTTFPKFPYKFPLEKFMAEIIFKSEPSHEVIAKGNLYVSIKQLP